MRKLILLFTEVGAFSTFSSSPASISGGGGGGGGDSDWSSGSSIGGSAGISGDGSIGSLRGSSGGSFGGRISEPSSALLAAVLANFFANFPPTNSKLFSASLSRLLFRTAGLRFFAFFLASVSVISGTSSKSITNKNENENVKYTSYSADEKKFPLAIHPKDSASKC
ncbi:hypothetical protein T11_8397 [Trichinella zimbabwensis]|uniref:Uncharacterized protein n=1 Tax=Trichinella zimbabwensis TaxID=268475 RepID=A0A0V1I5V0_9BILA|nr:hypothetical protein T11_8397 [Trichinella zimbabwensis]